MTALLNIAQDSIDSKVAEWLSGIGQVLDESRYSLKYRMSDLMEDESHYRFYDKTEKLIKKQDENRDEAVAALKSKNDKIILAAQKKAIELNKSFNRDLFEDSRVIELLVPIKLKINRAFPVFFGVSQQGVCFELDESHKKAFMRLGYAQLIAFRNQSNPFVSVQLFY